ncbi:MAG: phosphatase PAP2 family protein [Terriglobales bacterium]
MTPASRAKMSFGNIHYAISVLLALALIPLLKRFHLPVSFDWAKLASTFWLVLTAQSIFVAAFLCFVGFPTQEVLRPTIQRWRKNKVLIVVWLAYFLILFWQLTWVKALILTIDTIAILEFRERLKPGTLGKALLAVFLPACYLFVGFLVVFAYNDIILSVSFYGAADPTFSAMDKWLLHGASVSSICHWAVHVFPVSFFRFLQFIYFGMFAQIGAALLLTSLYYGKFRGLRFVGAILAAYYLALVLFYLWPSQGPYYLCPIHFSDFPNTLQVYGIQKNSILNSQALWNHVPIARISTDYYIAFPCMHIAQPLIALWFLRRWKRIVIILAAYDLLLLAAIILLEWHYVVDILGGILVALVAIATVDGHEFWLSISNHQLESVEDTRSA